jgi:hypothetical protein
MHDIPQLAANKCLLDSVLHFSLSQAQRGHLVTMVTARDADDDGAFLNGLTGSGREGSLRYAVVAGNENQSFMINATTGESSNKFAMFSPREVSRERTLV